MTRPLRFGRKAATDVAKGAPARRMVVFLHGYGADGSDLLGLADVLAPHMPGTVFLAPDAPQTIPGAPFGRQWFAIPRFDGSSEAEARAGLEAASDDLNAFLDAQLTAEGLGPQALAVVGFSQGAMMAYHAIPRRKVALAAVVAISGQVLQPQALAEATSKPPFLVMHGDQDEVVDFPQMTRACNALIENGFATYGHVMEGMGHGISQDGLGQMLAFLDQFLPA